MRRQAFSGVFQFPARVPSPIPAASKPPPHVALPKLGAHHVGRATAKAARRARPLADGSGAECLGAPDSRRALRAGKSRLRGEALRELADVFCVTTDFVTEGAGGGSGAGTPRRSRTPATVPGGGAVPRRRQANRAKGDQGLSRQASRATNRHPLSRRVKSPAPRGRCRATGEIEGRFGPPSRHMISLISSTSILSLMERKSRTSSGFPSLSRS